jgi:hypothetical protein
MSSSSHDGRLSRRALMAVADRTTVTAVSLFAGAA